MVRRPQIIRFSSFRTLHEHAALELMSFISERELKFMFAICHRASVCLSVCLSSVTLVHPTQTIEIFRNVSTP